MSKYKIKAITCVFITDMSNSALVKEFRATNAFIFAPEDLEIAKSGLLDSLDTVKKIVNNMEVS